MPASLSIVIPVFNKAASIAATLEAARAAQLASPFSEAEFVVVDDGSTDGTAERLRALQHELDLPLRIIQQENTGRFAARARGIEEARGEWVLLLDSRVRIAPGALAWVAEAIREQPDRRLWNGDCRIATDHNPYARFWNLLTEFTFRAYCDHRRTTSYGLAEFDRYPKGTGHFLAPREALLAGLAGFSSHYADLRNASDDTHLLRALAAREPISISPDFASSYATRSALLPFVRHAAHRGRTFVDGYLRPGSRFLPGLVAFYPASAAALVLTARRPALAPGLAGAGVAGAAAFAAARRAGREDTLAFSLLAPVWACAFGAGLWHGALLAARARLAAP